MDNEEQFKRYFLLVYICMFLSLGYSQENDLNRLNAQIVKSYQEGRYQEGIVLAEKSYKLSIHHWGKNHRNTLAAMNNLAELYRVQGEYSKAETLSVETLQLKKQILGENHPDTLATMSNLALLYQFQGKYSQAESLSLRTLKLKNQVLGENHPDTLTTMNNLALLYQFQGKYNQAKPIYIKVLQLRKKILGQKHPDTLKVMHNLAELYRSQGEYSKAESIYTKTWQIKREVLGEKHSDTLSTINNLATLYESQGKYTEAEDLYLKILQQTKEILGEKHSDNLKVMHNLAALYKSQKKYTEAKSLYLKVLKLREEVLGEKHPDTLISMDNLAGLYQFQEKYTEAKSLYLKVLKLREEVLGEKHPDTLISMNNLAVLYQTQEKYNEAKSLYLKVLRVRKETLGKRDPDTLTIMHNLAVLHYYEGDSDKTLSTMKEYLVNRYLFLKREVQGGSEKTRSTFLAKYDFFSDRNSLFSILLESRRKNFHSLALYFLANYKGILLQVSQNLRQIFSKSVDKELLEKFFIKRSEYSELFFNYEKRQNNPSLVDQLQREIDQLEKELIWKNISFKNLVSDVKTDEILNALSPKELLIDFTVYQLIDLPNQKSKKYQLAAVIASKENIELVGLGDLQDIQFLINDYRNRIQNKQKWRSSAQKIYHKIFSPLSKYFEKKSKLYIVPDGILHLLPFRSLVNENGEYLAKSKNIVILSSSRDLVIKRTEESNKSATIFAYPDYGNKEGKEIVEDKTIHFLPLKGTLEEAQAISPILNIPTKVYTKDQATEKNISQVDSPKILHIATHGYFLDVPEEETLKNQERGVTFKYKESSSPMKLNPKTMLSSNSMPNFNRNFSDKKLTNPLVYSGLALAGANNPGDEGILTALEVLGLNLRGTDLVVLSACETGVGEIRQGEGVYSLQRAFQEAGAKSVLATLWKVDDKATQLFMEKFYTRYMSGMSAQKAVRDTQLDFINSKRYSHPYYWSSFVMIGGRSDDLDQMELQIEKVVAEKSGYKFIISVIAIIMGLALLILAHRKKEKRLQEERIARRKRRREMKK